jgi:hypothetical protein
MCRCLGRGCSGNTWRPTLPGIPGGEVKSLVCATGSWGSVLGYVRGDYPGARFGKNSASPARPWSRISPHGNTEREAMARLVRALLGNTWGAAPWEYLELGRGVRACGPHGLCGGAFTGIPLARPHANHRRGKEEGNTEKKTRRSKEKKEGTTRCAATQTHLS